MSGGQGFAEDCVRVVDRASQETVSGGQALARGLWVVDRLWQETVSLARGDGTLYTSSSEVEAGRLSRIGLRW